MIRWIVRLPYLAAGGALLLLMFWWGTGQAEHEQPYGLAVSVVVLGFCLGQALSRLLRPWLWADRDKRKARRAMPESLRPTRPSYVLGRVLAKLTYRDVRMPRRQAIWVLIAGFGAIAVTYFVSGGSLRTVAFAALGLYAMFELALFCLHQLRRSNGEN